MKLISGVIVWLVLVGGLVFGYESEAADPEPGAKPEALSEEEIIAAIKGIGGRGRITPTVVDLSRTRATDAGLEYLKGLNGLQANRSDPNRTSMPFRVTRCRLLSGLC